MDTPAVPDGVKRHRAAVVVPVERLAADGGVSRVDDSVAAEEPLELRVEGLPVAVLMRTPGHDEEIAAGFLLTEGVIRTRADVFEISPCPSVAGEAAGNVIDALLVQADRTDLKRLTRHVFTTSSCGICGKASIDAVFQHFSPVAATGMRIAAATLSRCAAGLGQHQSVFRSTGGLHAAAVFLADGSLECLREDVGRHNAVDKVLGRALLDGRLPLDSHVLVVSGRVSFEIMQKALAASIPVVAGISAPTSLAISFARESGQTLAGFVRNGGMNLYAGEARIGTDRGSDPVA